MQPRMIEAPSSRCRVDGCNADLSQEKSYCRKHRICPQHMREEQVVVAGVPNRWCQQCAKFHPLSSFDKSYRSCRATLARHGMRHRQLRKTLRATSMLAAALNEPRPVSSGSSSSANIGSADPSTASTSLEALFQHPFLSAGMVADSHPMVTPAPTPHPAVHNHPMTAPVPTPTPHPCLRATTPHTIPFIPVDTPLPSAEEAAAAAMAVTAQVWQAEHMNPLFSAQSQDVPQSEHTHLPFAARCQSEHMNPLFSAQCQSERMNPLCSAQAQEVWQSEHVNPLFLADVEEPEPSGCLDPFSPTPLQNDDIHMRLDQDLDSMHLPSNRLPSFEHMQQPGTAMSRVPARTGHAGMRCSPFANMTATSCGVASHARSRAPAASSAASMAEVTDQHVPQAAASATQQAAMAMPWLQSSVVTQPGPQLGHRPVPAREHSHLRSSMNARPTMLASGVMLPGSGAMVPGPRPMGAWQQTATAIWGGKDHPRSCPVIGAGTTIFTPGGKFAGKSCQREPEDTMPAFKRRAVSRPAAAAATASRAVGVSDMQPSGHQGGMAAGSMNSQRATSLSASHGCTSAAPHGVACNNLPPTARGITAPVPGITAAGVPSITAAGLPGSDCAMVNSVQSAWPRERTRLSCLVSAPPAGPQPSAACLMQLPDSPVAVAGVTPLSGPDSYPLGVSAYGRAGPDLHPSLPGANHVPADAYVDAYSEFIGPGGAGAIASSAGCVGIRDDGIASGNGIFASSSGVVVSRDGSVQSQGVGGGNRNEGISNREGGIVGLVPGPGDAHVARPATATTDAALPWSVSAHLEVELQQILAGLDASSCASEMQPHAMQQCSRVMAHSKQQYEMQPCATEQGRSGVTHAARQRSRSVAVAAQQQQMQFPHAMQQHSQIMAQPAMPARSQMYAPSNPAAVEGFQFKPRMRKAAHMPPARAHAMQHFVAGNAPTGTGGTLRHCLQQQQQVLLSEQQCAVGQQW